MTPEDVAKLREKATPGPWKAECYTYPDAGDLTIWYIIPPDNFGTVAQLKTAGKPKGHIAANAAFIAAAPDMADLIAEQAREIAKLRAQVRLLRWATEPVRAARGQK